MTEVIYLRLTQVDSAEFLEDLRNLPGRWHELKGNLKNHISANLNGKIRILFTPNQASDTYMENNSMNWKKVVSLIVKGIVNTHE